MSTTSTTSANSSSNSTKRWRGLNNLIRDAVIHGSSAVEKIHLETARVPFMILEAIPVPFVAIPAKGIHAIHDTSTKLVYSAIRGTTHAVTTAIDVGLDAPSSEVNIKDDTR
jgi:hypothetical protein